MRKFDKAYHAGQVVRGIMRMHGKHRVYNNLYPSMRSVKCYAGTLKEDSGMLMAIRGALWGLGVNFEIKMPVYPKKGWGPFDSVIVRIF